MNFCTAQGEPDVTYDYVVLEFAQKFVQGKKKVSVYYIYNARAECCQSVIQICIS